MYDKVFSLIPCHTWNFTIVFGHFLTEHRGFDIVVACEYSRFSLLLATNDVSPGGNVPDGEELMETAVFAV